MRSQGSIVLVYIVMRHLCYRLNITKPHVKQKHNPLNSEKRGKGKQQKQGNQVEMEAERNGRSKKKGGKERERNGGQ